MGDQVSEEQLRLLVGEGRDPSTGVVLGRPYRVFASITDRVVVRVAGLDPELPEVERVGVVARIQGEEVGRGVRRAVAGFDFTFSVPKSASILWAVGDAGVRDAVEAAHRSAVADVVAFMEVEVAATRTGASDGSGAVVQAEVTGLIATAFDHFDSRAGDPHLHTHVVVANKAMTVTDGVWRSLDGRPLHASVVALSELHEGLVMDRLARDLGVVWEPRGQGRDRNPSWAIRTVPEDLVRVFSSRSQDIDTATDTLITEYVGTHGHRPSAATVMKLRAQATLSTRPEKHVQALTDLTEQWRARAGEVLGRDAVAWASDAVDVDRTVELRATDVTPEVAAGWGAHVVGVVGEKRATWRHWNLLAETARQTMGWRFATTEDRRAAVAAIVAAAERASVALSPPELAVTPVRFRRPDGSSRFRPRYSMVYTSTALLEAEARLLDLGRDQTGPQVAGVVVAHLTAPPRLPGRPGRQGVRLGADQVAAVTAVVSSGRVVDVLVGPAGAGKTTAMRALRRIWEAGHGTRSVIGLAPSAAAAEVLGTDLGVGAENTAKWLHDHHTGVGTPLRRGHLVIVDEASLAGTGALDEIGGMVREAGAKLLLVGDAAQLQAVDAGGAFAMLAADRDTPPELTDVRRFRAGWEKTASLALRHGDPSVVDTYAAHDRLMGGTTEAVIEQALAAWRADVGAGRSSVLIADTAGTVRDLSARARAHRLLDGTVRATGSVRLHDGTEASAGDLVITRRNDRHLHTGRGWVRNGDRWTVLSTTPDGGITVRRAGRRLGRVHLPASYVAKEVELGYAITAHRAQGATVDTGHAVITATSTRETAYVALTRGRETNTAYIATDQPGPAHTPPSDTDGLDPAAAARAVLAGVLARTGVERSAHDTMRAEQDTAASIRVLAAEYDTLATAAQHDRWVTLIRTSGLTTQQAEQAVESDAFGPLTHTLRSAEADHHDPATLLPRVVAVAGLDDAADIAAVLHARLTRALTVIDRGRTRSPARWVVGLIPEAGGPMDPEMAAALAERAHLIEDRATRLAETALGNQHPWTGALGTRPTDPQTAATWEQQVRIVAAYRDLHTVTGPTPLGIPTDLTSQQRDATRAGIALSTAQRVTATPLFRPDASPSAIQETGLSR